MCVVSCKRQVCKSQTEVASATLSWQQQKLQSDLGGGTGFHRRRHSTASFFRNLLLFVAPMCLRWDQRHTACASCPLIPWGLRRFQVLGTIDCLEANSIVDASIGTRRYQVGNDGGSSIADASIGTRRYQVGSDGGARSRMFL